MTCSHTRHVSRLSYLSNSRRYSRFKIVTASVFFSAGLFLFLFFLFSFFVCFISSSRRDASPPSPLVFPLRIQRPFCCCSCVVQSRTRSGPQLRLRRCPVRHAARSARTPTDAHLCCCLCICHSCSCCSSGQCCRCRCQRSAIGSCGQRRTREQQRTERRRQRSRQLPRR